MKFLKSAILILFLATQAHASTQVRRSFVEKTFTPATSTTAYSAGDQMGGLSTLTGVPQDSSGFATLWGIDVIDQDKQGSSMDLLFFNDTLTLNSADNAAFSIAGSDAVSKFVGRVNVPTSAYFTASGAKLGSVLGVNLPIKATSASKLYVVAVTNGTPTYNAASSLTIKLLFGQE